MRFQIAILFAHSLRPGYLEHTLMVLLAHLFLAPFEHTAHTF